ncbi:MAG TPA: membrane dipeptidase [Candidatus Limnocylindrales bacterium]|nr:membrane dipeptidase [Candidatus Limnocylindrales bacterium]
MISRAADRALNRRARGAPSLPLAVEPEVAAFHASIPVVDLVVGSALFRADLLAPHGPGHVDLERARAGGLDLVGLTIATRYPDLHGWLSAPHFRSLGIRPGRPGDLAIVAAFVRRIEAWAARSGGRLVLTRGPEDLETIGDGLAAAAAPAAPADPPAPDRSAELPEPPALRAFIGVQSGQALDGDPRNVAALTRLGVRMLGLAHTMDSPLAGSSTGRRGGGLTGLGREVVAELEAQGVLVDLAHASMAAIRETVPLLKRPFVVSHTGFTALATGGPRWRRFRPGRRNLEDAEARLVGQAGGLIGVSLASPLVGASSLEAIVRTFEHAVDLVGPDQVALGSDFDGALPMPFDVTALPHLTAALLGAGFGRGVVAGIMGRNALRVLRGAPARPA